MTSNATSEVMKLNNLLLVRENWWRLARWNDNLMPVITQDAETGVVLSLSWLNRDALARSLTLGNTHFFSRGRKVAWTKGEQSGNTQFLHRICLDCDCDVVLMVVSTWVSSCHTNRPSCFYSNIRSDYHAVLRHVSRIAQSIASSTSYTLRALSLGSEKMVKKTTEEVVELVLSLSRPEHIMIVKEISDLHYHLLVLLMSLGVNPEVITDELKSRMNLSGVHEKDNRTISV